MENMKTWRMISWAASVAAPMRLTNVVAYKITPIVPRFRTDRASPDCRQSRDNLSVQIGRAFARPTGGSFGRGPCIGRSAQHPEQDRVSSTSSEGFV